MDIDASSYDFDGRVNRARKLMKEQDIDGLYIVAGSNMLYFTGFTAYVGGWPVWLSAFILPSEGDAALIMSDMHYDIYKARGGSWVSDVRTHMDGEDPTGLLGDTLQELGLAGGRLGVQDDMGFADAQLIRSAAPETELVSGSPIVDQLRMIKDAQEIENLRKANEISGIGFAAARESIRPGRQESEVALEIGKAMLDAGSDRLAVGGHLRDMSNRKFQVGDPVDVDVAGVVQGYGADTARMVFIGDPTPEVERMYRVAVEAFHATMEVIKPGVPCEEVHRVCAGYMAKHGYEQVWKVGHGVGLGPIHEAPLVEDGNTTPLEPGMIFTVDPGCFLEGGYRDLPIHIEDDVLVTEDGAETLTTYTKELVVV